MPLPHQTIAEVIDAAELNRGLRGADWLASEGNIPVTFDNGDIALFEDEGQDTFEVHFLFVSRGREAIARVREAFRIMFAEHGAKVIFGLVPDFNRKMKLVARWAGAKSAGLRPTSEGPCELYVISNTMFYRDATQ